MTESSNKPSIRFTGFTDPWEQRKLGEIADSFDYGLNAAATAYDGKNGYLRITDIDDSTRRFSKNDLTSPDADLNQCEDYRLSEGDIVFARTGASVGKTYIYQAKDGITYFAGFLIRVRLKSDVDPCFVFQSTLGEPYKRYVSITSQRSGQPGVNAEEYAECPVLMPSLAEQRAIGQFFSRLDSLITLHQRKYDKLVVLKKSMLEQMFPQEGESVPKIRFAGFTDPWEQRKLGNIASFTKGNGYSKADIRESGVPLFLYGRMYTQYEAAVESVDTFAMPKQGTLYSTGKELVVPASGESAEDIARASAICRAGIALGGDLNVIYPQEMAKPLFLAYGLSHGSNRKLLAQRAQGKTVVHIHASDLEGLSVELPSIPEQQTIGRFFSRLDSLITLHQRKLELLQNIKKSLLEQMFV